MTKPISVLPTSPPECNPVVFYLKLVLYVMALMLVSVSIVTIQVSVTVVVGMSRLLPLVWPDKTINGAAQRLYLSAIQWTERVFASFVVIANNILIPARLVITGDVEVMTQLRQYIVTANHQIYPDWLYLWSLARLTSHHGDVKIMLMDSLRLLPVLGWGMWFFEFIFLKRRLALDKATIEQSLCRYKQALAGMPLWLLIFPEGTLNTPNNRQKSIEYAKKNDITEIPEYVILPKATGLFMCCDELKSVVDNLFDVTVGYSGLSAELIPYEEYLLTNVFFAGYYPKEIHLHIQRFEIAKLPGFTVSSHLASQVDTHKRTVSNDSLDSLAGSNDHFDPATNVRREIFSHWLHKRYMFKDALMREFYQNGCFPSEEVGVSLPKPLKKLVYDQKPVLLDYLTLAIAITLFFYLSSCYFHAFVQIITFINYR